jgi:Skp family chaperone for outer membrane proteins
MSEGLRKTKISSLAALDSLALFLVIGTIVLPALAQCPAGSELVRVERKGNEEHTFCRCLAGYVARGTQCVPAPAAASVDIDKPVDPGALVTADIYESAKRRLAYLRNLETKLVGKQAELAKWRGDMLAEKREFDRLHAEAAHGELAEVIEIIPAEAVLGQLLERGMIASESAAKLKTTFQRLKEVGKALASTAEARDERDLLKVQITATTDTINELIADGKDLPLDSPERLWELRTVRALKMFSTTAKAMMGTMPQNEAKWWERAEPAADLIADLAGIAMPPFGVALKAERVVDREARKYVLSQAQNSLGGAVADNWNAGIYLSQKLVRVRSDITETRRTVESYEARTKN